MTLQKCGHRPKQQISSKKLPHLKCDIPNRFQQISTFNCTLTSKYFAKLHLKTNICKSLNEKIKITLKQFLTLYCKLGSS
jgi:hypothetical protein